MPPPPRGPRPCSLVEAALRNLLFFLGLPTVIRGGSRDELAGGANFVLQYYHALYTRESLRLPCARPRSRACVVHQACTMSAAAAAPRVPPLCAAQSRAVQQQRSPLVGRVPRNLPPSHPPTLAPHPLPAGL